MGRAPRAWSRLVSTSVPMATRGQTVRAVSERARTREGCDSRVQRATWPPHIDTSAQPVAALVSRRANTRMCMVRQSELLLAQLTKSLAPWPRHTCAPRDEANEQGAHPRPARTRSARRTGNAPRARASLPRRSSSPADSHAARLPGTARTEGQPSPAGDDLVAGDRCPRVTRSERSHRSCTKRRATRAPGATARTSGDSSP